MKKRNVICAALLAGAMAVSAMSMGFAAWQTNITGSGNVAASGKWDVAITDASLNLSSGASASQTVTTYELQRTGVKDDTLIAATISSSTWVQDAALVGTQSDSKVNGYQYVYYYAVDTSKYSLDTLESYTTKDAMNVVREDPTTVCLFNELNAYYRYVSGDPTVGTAAGSQASAAKVVDGMLRDSIALLKERFPDTYQNYLIVYIGGSGWGQFSHTIASMVEKTDIVAVDGENGVSYTATDVNFADVTFGLPGAWAQYSLTVTNNGTVSANLADAVIELNTDSDQLVLNKPDLSEEVLQPGESCTITFVVKVPDTITEDLDATGTLTVTLPYSQATVEAAPVAGHTHG